MEHLAPLVIADLLLPGVAGDGVLQGLGPARVASRVLYLSGDLEDTVEESRGLRPGRGFLHKPFTLRELSAIVRRTLDERRPGAVVRPEAPPRTSSCVPGKKFPARSPVRGWRRR